MFFTCSESSWREDVAVEGVRLRGIGYNEYLTSTLRGTLKPLQLDDNGIVKQKDYAAFTGHLNHYLIRKLSFTSDTLNAFTGVSNLFEHALETAIVFGLPAAFFDLALLWQSDSMTVLTRNEEFPSWSWAGWSGPRQMLQHEFGSDATFLTRHTWIDWYIYNDDFGNWTPLRNLVCQPDVFPASMTDAYRQYFARMNPPRIHTNAAHMNDAVLPQFRAIQDIKTLINETELQVVPDVERLVHARAGMLRFFTVTVSFDVVLRHTCGALQPFLVIEDFSETAIGQLELVGDETAWDFLLSDDRLRKQHKFILISESKPRGDTFEGQTCHTDSFRSSSFAHSDMHIRDAREIYE